MRSHKLVRSIVLAVASAALAAVLFAIYQYSETTSTPRGTVGSRVAAPADLAARPEPEEETGSEILIGEERLPVKSGGQVEQHLYRPDGEVWANITFAEWQPIGEESNEFEVTAPILRLRTPGGQLVKISGGKGRVLLKSTDPRSPEPKSGHLIGDVRITVDRLSDEQRAALPEDERDVIDERRTVDLFMDDVFFDLEFARIETSGPFRLRAAELSLEGTGLSVRYNELDSRIEELIISKGESIEVRGMGDRFDLELAASPPENAEATETGARRPLTTKPAAPVPAKTTPAATDDGEDLPIVVPDEPDEGPVHPTDTYHAVFAGDVRVTQYDRDAQVGRLAADQLAILFDFGQRERDMVKRSPPTSAGMSARAARGDGPATSGSGAPAGEDRVLLTWTGPLRVTSEARRKELPPGRSAGDAERVHITATGAQVLVSDPRRQLTCRKLVYHRETGLLQMFGAPDDPARLASREMGELSGRKIVLDRLRRRAHAEGPGRLVVNRAVESQAPRPASSVPPPWFFGARKAPSRNKTKMDVRFETAMDATFDEAVLSGVDPQTGAARRATQLVLRTASFNGTVDMVYGRESVQCDGIDINFAVTEEGKPYPTDAEAYGTVIVFQGDRYIHAVDRVLVDLEMIEVDRPPFDPVRARQVALAHGKDPDALDWAAIRADYERRKDYQPGLRRLQAYGEVEVRDPVQSLEISCEALDCRFTKGRRIESGLVWPEKGKSAYVALGEFSIAAPGPIPFDVARQSANVDGPGRMTFLTEQDFDGTRLDKPTLVIVKWSRRMEFEGPTNEALFSGNVHAETAKSTFDCDNLRIDFVDVPPSSKESRRQQADADSGKWIFTPLFGGGASDTNDWDERLALAESSSFNKDPVFVYATGDVVALTQNVDPESKRLKSRARIAGPKMAIDLRREYVLVDGAGNLLIEDYKIVHAPSDRLVPAEEPAVTTPFGRVIGNEPSQTYIGWESTMTYRYGINVAQFDGNVALVHRTGAKMKLAQQILGEQQMGTAKRGGRESTLDCQSLVVRFLRSLNDDQASVGRLSGYDVDAFNASGQVHFTDGPISAIAGQITYTREDNILQILGTDTYPAQLFDQKKRFRSLRGPKFYWDRAANQIKAPRSRGSMR